MERILGISGKVGAGKSSVARMLANWSNGKAEVIGITSFAEPIKTICHDVLGLSFAQCWGTHQDKETMTPYGKSARRMMQDIGMLFREKFGEDVFAKATIRQARRMPCLLVIIDDVRFPNEIAAIRRAGGKVIRLLRHEPTTGARHESETALDDYHGWDAIVDNRNLSVQETSSRVLEHLRKWEFLPCVSSARR